MPVLLAIVGAVAGIAGLSVAVVAHNRVNQVVEECADALRRQLQVASGASDNQALRDLAIVHYDALREMSGRRSFSLALINAVGDGVVFSSINGRTETRTYAKVVKNGRGVEVLSPEEDQALRAARLGKGPVVDMDDPLPDFGRDTSVPAPSNGRVHSPDSSPEPEPSIRTFSRSPGSFRRPPAP
jgi:hypothetical protein